MVDNIEYTINHGLSYETANYLQNMGDGRLMPVPVRAIALDFPRFAIMHDHAATGDRIEYNGLEYQIDGPVRRYLGWAIFQVKQAMARGAAWVPNFTPGAPRARDIVQRVGGVVLLDAPGNSIGPGVTFSRANQAMVRDEQGNWTWTALPYRRSYDMVAKEWGYLFEPQRTNYIYCINRSAGDILMTVNGVTYTVIQPIVRGDLRGLRIRMAGTPTQVYGSASLTNSSADTSLVGAGKAATYSGFCEKVSGTGRARLMVGLADFNYQSLEPRTGRGSFSGTFPANPTGSTGEIRIEGEFTVGVDVDAIYDVWGLQIEAGSIATSPIATTGAAKTVAADVCTYANNVLTDAAGTVVARALARGTQAHVVLNMSDGNVGVSGTGRATTWDGTSETATSSGQLGAAQTLCYSWGGSSKMAAIAGGGETTGAYDGSIMRSDQFVIGGQNTSGTAQMLNGYINHLSVFPTQLDAATRQLLLSVVQ